MPDTQLNKEEQSRYARQISLPNVGEEGQVRLKQSKVLIIGMGGLGSPVAMYLAASGAGTLGLMDGDRVELSNLQRQPLFAESDIGEYKVDVAATRIKGQNRHVNVVTYEEHLTVSNAADIIADYDLVVDGTDNLSTRYLINDACVLLGKPFVYGAIFRFSGQVSSFNVSLSGSAGESERSACYRCLYPHNPPVGRIADCTTGGVIGVLPAVIGSLQATEAIKILLGVGKPLMNRLMQYDALSMSFNEIKFKPKESCPACGSDNDNQITTLNAPEYSSLMIPADHFIDESKYSEMKEQGSLLDVRDADEVSKDNIANTIHIPLIELANRVGELDYTQTYYVFCQSGKRAEQAVQLLMEQDFEQVYVITGGVPTYSSIQA